MKEKAQQWPETPEIQGQLSEFQKKVQTLKKAIHNADLSIDEATSALHDASKAFEQLEPIYNGLSDLSQDRPILRRSVDLADQVLDALDDAVENLQFYVDLQSRMSSVDRLNTYTRDQTWQLIESNS